MNGWRVDSYANSNQGRANQGQNHCLRARVRTRCMEGAGRRIYNTGSSIVWDPAFEEDIGPDLNWNCQYCCLDVGKSLATCPVGTNAGGHRNSGHNSNQEYHNGWRVDSYQNGVQILSEPDPTMSRKSSFSTDKCRPFINLDLFVSLSVCGATGSGTSDRVALEFRTQNGNTCKTNEEFNSNGALNSNGQIKIYPWRIMGDCSRLEQYDSNLEFRLQTTIQQDRGQFDKLKVCKLRVSTQENTYTWQGLTVGEGTGEWQTLSKDRKCITRGFHFSGYPLKVFKNGTSNSKRNVNSIEECMQLCKRYVSCSWFNWIDGSGQRGLKNTCWLKRGKGRKGAVQGGFTGPGDSSVLCS